MCYYEFKVFILFEGEDDLKSTQKRSRPLIGFYLYCIQGLALSIVGFLTLARILDTPHDSVYQVYQFLRHLLYLPVLILILYAFKSILRLKNRELLKSTLSFMLFGMVLFYIGKLEVVEYDLLFFFLMPVFLYVYNRVVLKKFIRGYSFTRLLLHYFLLFFIFFMAYIVMEPILAHGGRYTLVEHLHINAISIKDDIEIYVSNPALIFLLAMVVFVSAQRIKKSPKHRAILFLSLGVLYTVLYSIFIKYINA